MFLLFGNRKNRVFVKCFGLYVCVCVWNSSAGAEEEAGGHSRQRHNRHGRDGGAAAAPGSLEKRIEELEKVRSPMSHTGLRHIWSF